MTFSSKLFDTVGDTQQRIDLDPIALNLDIDALLKASGVNEKTRDAYLLIAKHFDTAFQAEHAASGSMARRILMESIDIMDKEIGNSLPLFQKRLDQYRYALGVKTAGTPEGIAKAIRKPSKKGEYLPESDAGKALHLVWFSVWEGNYGVDAMRLFKRLSPALDVHDPKTIDKLTKLLSRSTKIGKLKKGARKFRKNGIVDPTSDAFRSFFRSNATALKGKIIEAWFYNHHYTRNVILPKLEEKAEATALRLSELSRDFEFEVKVVTDAARMNGLEITDGMVLVLQREIGPGPRAGKIVGAVIDTIIEIKSEQRSKVLEQFVRNQSRLSKPNAGGHKIIVTFDDPSLGAVRILPSLEPPSKVVVAANSPTPGQLTETPAAGDAVLFKTSPSAQDADDVAFTLLAALIDAVVPP